MTWRVQVAALGALTVLCVLAHGPAFCQVPALSVRAHVGIAGAARSGLPAPVIVDVDAASASGPAVVRYRVRDKRWERAISLAPGTRKRCELLVDSIAREAQVEVCTPQGDVLANVDAVHPDELVAEVLYTVLIARPEQQHAPPALAGLQLEQGAAGDSLRVDVRFVRAAELPEHWAAFAAVDCLVIGDDDVERATPAAMAALLDWTARGGALIVSGGARPARLAGTPLAGVLPVELTGRTVTLDALKGLDAMFPGTTLSTTGGAGLPLAASDALVVREPFVVAEARVRAGARELVTEKGPGGPVPLLARGRLGDGSVTYVGLDLERSPFAYTGRVAAARMWRAILPRPGRREARRYSMRQEVRTSELAHGRIRAEPADMELAARATGRHTPWVVAGFLALYWLLVGPGQYLVLRRRRALHLVWVVTPVISIAFSIAAFGLGYLERGSATLARELTVVFGRAGDPVAAADSLVRVHAFKELGYTVRGEGGASISMPLAADATEACVVASNGVEVSARDVPVPMWSERTFHLQRSAQLPRVEARLDVTSDQPAYLGPGRRVRGTITVHGGPLRGASLQMGAFHAPLGDLEADRPRSVDERLTVKTPEQAERNWSGQRRGGRRVGLAGLVSEPGWWKDLGAATAQDHLELVGVAGADTCPPPVVEPAVGALERAVLVCVGLDYHVIGQQEAQLSPGYAHRRTATNADLSLGQIALTGPLVFETQLTAFPRPGFQPQELTLLFARHEKPPVNVFLKHPVRGTWDLVYAAGSAGSSGTWSDTAMRIDVSSGAEYVRMPRAVIDVKLEPTRGTAPSGGMAKMDFEVRGLDEDPAGWP